MLARALVVACVTAAACGRIDFTTVGNAGDPGSGPGSDDGPPPAAACGVVQDTPLAALASWNGSSYGVMWYDGAGPGLYLQRVAANGGRIGTPVLAVPESMSSWAGVLATAHGYAVTWLDPAQRVDFVLLDPAGKELTAPGPIGGDRVTSVLYGPPSYGFYVEPMSTGVAVFWMGDDLAADQHTWLSIADAVGAKTGSDIDLSGTSSLDLIDGIAAHDDVFAIVHGRSNNGSGNATLLGQRNPAGALVGPEVTIEPNLADFAGVAWSGDRYGVAWRHQQGTAFEVSFATYSTAPARLSGPTVLATAPRNGDVLGSAVAWTGQDFVVAWILQDDVMNLTLQYARVTATGTPGPTTTVPGTRGPLYLTVAGGGGGALLAWTNSDGFAGSFTVVCPGTP